jgi:hypothetical protein
VEYGTLVAAKITALLVSWKTKLLFYAKNHGGYEQKGHFLRGKI